jgi:competence protein ComEC
MSNALFYTIPIGLCVGIFFRSLFNLPDETVLLLLLLSFAIAVIWRRRDLEFSSPLFVASLFLLCASVGLFRFDAATWRESALTQFANNEVALEGIVVREPDVRASVQHLYIEENGSTELFLVTTDRFTPVSYGDRIVAEGTLKKPEAFETDLGRTFDYEGYLRARGVEYAMFFANVSIVGSKEGNPVLEHLISWKQKFMNVLEAAVPEPQAGLAEGLLLGVKRALGDDLEGAFRTTGIIHIVVLSGYNLMIVADALMRVLSFFFRPMMRMVFGILAIVLFAVMVGLSATVIRAAIMAALLLYARATGRNGHALRALCVAGVAMLLINPHLLVYDPGFQLSFLATLGLILVSPAIEHFFKLAPTTLQIREFIIATIATQIMVLPLLLYLIGEFSVVAVLVNVLILPMVPVAMGLSFFTVVFGAFLPMIASLIGFLASMSLSYIIVTATLFASLPFASFVVPAFPFWAAVLAYGVLALLLAFAHHRGADELVAGPNEENGFKDWEIVSLQSVLAKVKPAPSLKSDTDFPFR